MGECHGDEVVKFLHVEQESKSKMVFCVMGMWHADNKIVECRLKINYV